MEEHLILTQTAQTTCSKGRKQETRYCSCFSMINCLQKGSNCIIEPCEPRNKTQCMYLSFKNLKISSSKGQYW